MVGSNNSTILTVSYGTFSCTLEGFEDSFDTMKAIAEYFRDLAADDRYFGAEPPTPDAEMLTRIAEKEVSRKVEAVSRDGGVTLRPYQIEDASEVEEPAPVAEPKPEPEVARAPEPTPVPEAAPEPAQAEDTVGYVENEDYSENFFPATEPVGLAAAGGSVAARLQRIREAAAHKTSEETLEDAFDEHEQELVAEAPSIEDAFEEDADELVAEDTDDSAGDIEELIGDASEEPADEEETLEDAAEEEAAYDEEDLLEESAAEDEPQADEFSDEDEDDFEQLLADAVSEDTELAAADIENEDAPTDDEFAELLKGIDTTTFDDEDEIAEKPQGSPFTARVVHVKGVRDGDDEADAEELLGDDGDDFEGLTSGTLDSIFDDEADGVDTESSLSEEDEADLMRELAEAELSDDDEDTLLDEDAEVEVADKENLFSDDPEEALANAQDLSALLTGEDSEVEVDRLMNEAENHLTSEETNRRRSTIEHLKAAVASKRADSEAGEVDPEDNDTVAYVEDLADAVKPKRPVLSGPKTPRERVAPVAPLKLVAEQKIVPDTHEPTEPRIRPTLVKPVRPRRIRATASAAAEAAAVLEPEIEEFAEAQETFVVYAERMEVSKLPEILEAAAAFVVYSEGLEKFSRPQLMGRVREVMGDEFTREDGLRAFGKLLREGKIVKVSGGRFTASETIGFQPE